MAFDPIKLLMLPVLLLSITVHECAHAFTAKKAGDNTAEMLGRITLNPIPHIDLFGTIILPIIAMLTSIPAFGWAKPVPVNPRNYKKPYWDIIVSLAGPGSNLLLAILATAGLKIFLLINPEFSIDNIAETHNKAMQAIGYILFYTVVINILLTIFNLMPIPPLDGSHVLFYKTLPGSFKEQIYIFLGQFGFWILLMLFVAVPFTNKILANMIINTMNLLFKIFFIS